MKQKYWWIGCLLLMIGGVSVSAAAQPKDSTRLIGHSGPMPQPICGTPFISQKITSVMDIVPDTTNKFYQKYQNELTSIAHYYRELGFDITPLLKHPEFKIYEGIDERFIGSAENTSPNLAEYKEILGFKYKANKIDEFIARHIETLKKAEKKYGISKFIIAAILGVESNFGNNIGSHDPFNVYISMLVVDYRTEFARAQLKHLLMFVERENIEVHSLKSSYAGAMSYAQFIPYSVNKWWVGDELFDMTNNILSVANYLAYFKARTDDKVTMLKRYNPSSLYAHAVLDLAEVAREKYLGAHENS